MKNASPVVQGLYHERPYEVPAVQKRGEIHPLCHEHHVEMRLCRVLLKTGRKAVQTRAYVCPVLSCLVRYDTSLGYFISTQKGNGIERDIMPRVACSQDGVRMYLAEIDLEKRSFRLWRCPQCHGIHTNEQGVNGAD